MLYLCTNITNPNKTYTGRAASTIAYHLMYHMTDLIEFYKSYSRKTKDLLNVNIL